MVIDYCEYFIKHKIGYKGMLCCELLRNCHTLLTLAFRKVGVNPGTATEHKEGSLG